MYPDEEDGQESKRAVINFPEIAIIFDTLGQKKKKENNNNNVQERSFALAHEWRTSLIEVFEHSECFAIDRRVDMS